MYKNVDDSKKILMRVRSSDHSMTMCQHSNAEYQMITILLSIQLGRAQHPHLDFTGFEI